MSEVRHNWTKDEILEIYNKPMRLNSDLLDDEKNQLLNFIKNNM